MIVVSFFPFLIIGVAAGVCLTVLLNLLLGVWVKKKQGQTWYYQNGDGLTKGPFNTETMQRLYMKELFSDTLVRSGPSGKWELIENYYQTLCHSAQWHIVATSNAQCQGLDAYDGPFSNDEMRAKFLAGEVSASKVVNPSTQINAAAAVQAFFPLLSSAFLSDPCHPGQRARLRASYTGKSNLSDKKSTIQQPGAEDFFDMNTLSGENQRGSRGRGSLWPAAEKAPSSQHWPAAEGEAPEHWAAAEEVCTEHWPAADCPSEASWPAHSQSLSSSCGDGSEDITAHSYNPNLKRESDSTQVSGQGDQLEQGLGPPSNRTKSRWSRGREYVEAVVKPVLEKGLEYVETGHAKIQERLTGPPQQPLGNSDNEEGDPETMKRVTQFKVLQRQQLNDPEMSQSVQLNDPGGSSSKKRKPDFGLPRRISNFGPLASHKAQPSAGSANPQADKFGWSSFGPVGKKPVGKKSKEVIEW